MVSGPTTNSTQEPGRFDLFSRVVYELGLLIGVVTLVLSAVHGLATHHANIDETIDANHVRATVDNPQQFHLGEHYPIYRFNEGWQEPIGEAKAETLAGNRLTLQYDPHAFRWPMGRHGKVVSVEGDRLKLNFGQDLGFVVGTKLNLFSGRNQVGTAQLESVGQVESIATPYLTDGSVPATSLVGMTVTEFVVATQVVQFNSPFVNALDIFLVGLVLGGYALLWFRLKDSPLCVLLPRIANRIHPSENLKLGFHAVLGLPSIWFISDFAIRAFSHSISLLYENLVHSDTPPGFSYESLAGVHGPLFGAMIIAYEISLFNSRVSPFSLIAKRFAFKGGFYGHPAKELPEHLTMWLLHLVIVYTFARFLAGAFQDNLNAAIVSTWPQSPPVEVQGVNPVSFEGLARSFNAIAYAVSNAPRAATDDLMWITIRNLIDDCCILGALFGYGYSVLGYLWGKRIRNIDFTIGGWLTNAICYGPLFGVVLWQMVPSAIGVDPTVTHGGFRTMTFIVETLANIIYTITIWNLGTMFGVMTDKGVRTSGFYSVVRHPSYTLESLMFMLVYCRGLSSIGQWCSVGCFLLIYWIRSEREDQFMGASNPDYLPYRERVKYKFIPGLY